MSYDPCVLPAGPDMQLGAALRLPTFEVERRLLYERLTLVSENARIVKIFDRCLQSR